MARPIRIAIFGIGAFTQAFMRQLREAGAEVCGYLTRPYGHYGPSLEGRTYAQSTLPNPCRMLRDQGIDLVIPMSLEWIHQHWAEEFLALGIPFLCPTGEALQLERDRTFARNLCGGHGVPFPKSHLARDRSEAEALLRADPRPYVIKNPLCSPQSPIHTIVCETLAETKAWLPRLDYAEGVFLQEYLGRAEVGHIALVSAGQIHSMVTNQEYKRAFDGNMGIVAGAPLGGFSEQDPHDKYGLAHALLGPLLPWFQATGFHGPVQVTAARQDGRWQVLEYNVRMGVTNGPLILGMLENPAEVLLAVARNLPCQPRFKPERQFGASLTLAGYGYPYTAVLGPAVPLHVEGPMEGNVWWNEAGMDDGALVATGHRVADFNAFGPTLQGSLSKVYRDIKKVSCYGCYHRTDVGQSLWPPGQS